MLTFHRVERRVRKISEGITTTDYITTNEFELDTTDLIVILSKVKEMINSGWQECQVIDSEGRFDLMMRNTFEFSGWLHQ